MPGMRFATSLISAVMVAAALAVAGAPSVLATADPICGGGTKAGPVSGVYTCTYLTTGADTFTVPPTVGSVTVEAIGGKGGYGNQAGTYFLSPASIQAGKGFGGNGAKVAAFAAVTGGHTLTVFVAGNGGTSGSGVGAGGGGAGGIGTVDALNGGGGGGASSVKDGSTLLVVAGGGGGGAGEALNDTYLVDGGSAGNANGTANHGGTSPGNCVGGGGADMGGVGAGGTSYECSTSPGAPGLNSAGGAGGGNTRNGGGGGGGGYYGGGGGAASSVIGQAAGGGGGSSYSTDPHAVITTMTTAEPKDFYQISVKISWQYPDGNITLGVKNYANDQWWDNTATAGAKAYASASMETLNGIPPTGQLQYDFYAQSVCGGSVVSTQTVDLDVSANVPASNPTAALPAGYYSYRATYPGDANYVTYTTCTSFFVLAGGAGAGTMTAPTDVVSAGVAGQTIAFIYTLAGAMSNGEIRLTVPAGWSAPSGTGTAPGFVKTDKVGLVASVSGRTISISHITANAGYTIQIIYGQRSGGGPGAVAPTIYGAQTWTAEQKATASGSVQPLAASPVITVMAKDGSGTMTASPTTAKHNSTGKTITFTYTVAAGGISGGFIDLLVPKGWSLPSTNPTAAGYVTTSSGQISASGRGIAITNLTLPAGAHITITYGSRIGGGPGAKAPSAIGTKAWKSREESTPFPFSRLKALAVSPKITVT